MDMKNKGLFIGKCAGALLVAVLLGYLLPRVESVSWDYKFFRLLYDHPKNKNVPLIWIWEGVKAFDTYTKEYRVSKRLAYEVFNEESRGEVFAYNKKSACRGVGQIHEVTAKYFHLIHPKLHIFRKGKIDPHRLYEPAVNIRVSMWALRWGLDYCDGNEEAALVVYNAGSGVYRKTAAGMSYAETILSRTSLRYRACLWARKILKRFSLYTVEKGSTK